jgi:ribonuclease P protein component
VASSAVQRNPENPVHEPKQTGTAMNPHLPKEGRSGAPTGFRFPKSARLLKHSDFDRVYRQGRRYALRNMAMFYLRREGNETPGIRVGLTVGRALGGAVVRNRIKRRLREVVRLSLADPELQPDFAVDVVINPRKAVATVDFADLKSEVAEGLRAIRQKGSRQSGAGSRRKADSSLRSE